MTREEKIVVLEKAKEILIAGGYQADFGFSDIIGVCDSIAKAYGMINETYASYKMVGYGKDIYIKGFTFNSVKILCKQNNLPLPTHENYVGFWWDKTDKKTRLKVVDLLIKLQ
jgi:hypothetical protein